MDNRSPLKNESQQNTQAGFGVAPSPFNGVKLELGLILVLAIVVWLAADIITPEKSSQLLILFVYGLLAMGWLVLRTRRVLRQHLLNLESRDQE